MTRLNFYDVSLAPELSLLTFFFSPCFYPRSFSSLLTSSFFISSFIYNRFPDNIVTSVIGVWHTDPTYGRSVPVGGLAYLLSAPTSIAEALRDPFHALFYVAFVLGSCALFSKAWIEISGQTPKDVLKQLRSQNMVMRGHRENSMLKTLYRYIPTTAAVGGLCIGLLSILSDFMGVIGSGTGILMSVTIIFEYFEKFAKEAAETGSYASILS